ncbi:MAG: S8 family serine peptidase [Phycisphaerales bacterium]|nr:S8 family serine peptidase [Phycisphaerales bacterium]
MFLFGLATLVAPAHAQQADDGCCAPSVDQFANFDAGVLVRLSRSGATTTSQLHAWAQARGLSARPSLQFEPADAILTNALALRRYYILTSTTSTPAWTLAAGIESDLPGVVLAERVAVGGQTEAPLPNDPLFSQQYGMHNVGQEINGVPGAVDADVNAPEAWAELPSDLAPITVAILDAGMSLMHTEFAGRILPGHNTTINGSPNDASDYMNGHGTHCAGILAASGNDASGVSGIAWTPSILPVKVATPVGSTSGTWLGNGIIWAVDHGARVLSISLGLTSGDAFLESAIAYADAHGCLIVASAGNENAGPVLYPAKYPSVMAIGGTNNRDLVAGFSSVGPEIDVVAPGWLILSTADYFWDPNTYESRSGTSMAAPLVAGIATLLFQIEPNLTPAEVRQIIRDTARDIGAPGFDEAAGYGRVCANAAVARVLGGDDPDPPTPAEGDAATPVFDCADYNLDGSVDSNDFMDFLNGYASGAQSADQDADGALTPDDVHHFIHKLWQGCGANGEYGPTPTSR